jgi:hypothetical protein
MDSRPVLIVIIHSTDIDGAEFIICLPLHSIWVLSQHLHWNSFRDFGDLSCRWEGTNVFLCPIFSSCDFFLHRVCERHDFQFCLLHLRLPGVSWRSQSVAWVSGWRCRLHFTFVVDDLLLLYEIDS